MRIDGKRVQALARDFVNSHRAELWSFVHDEIRHALIDAAIMDCVRTADAVDNQNPVTPSQLIQFRNDLIVMLRGGVASGKGRRRYRFDHDDVHAGLADPDGESSGVPTEMKP